MTGKKEDEIGLCCQTYCTMFMVINNNKILPFFLGHQNPIERLGCHPQTGFADITSHVFFRTVDWEQVCWKWLLPTAFFCSLIGRIKTSCFKVEVPGINNFIVISKKYIQFCTFVNLFMSAFLNKECASQREPWNQIYIVHGDVCVKGKNFFDVMFEAFFTVYQRHFVFLFNSQKQDKSLLHSSQGLKTNTDWKTLILNLQTSLFNSLLMTRKLFIQQFLHFFLLSCVHPSSYSSYVCISLCPLLSMSFPQAT